MAFWNLRGLNSSSSALAASSWDLIWAKLYSFDPGSGVPSPVVVGSFVAWVSLIFCFLSADALPACYVGAGEPDGGGTAGGGIHSTAKTVGGGRGCDEPAAPNARSAR